MLEVNRQILRQFERFEADFTNEVPSMRLVLVADVFFQYRARQEDAIAHSTCVDATSFLRQMIP